MELFQIVSVVIMTATLIVTILILNKVNKKSESYGSSEPPCIGVDVTKEYKNYVQTDIIVRKVYLSGRGRYNVNLCKNGVRLGSQQASVPSPDAEKLLGLLQTDMNQAIAMLKYYNINPDMVLL